jgi:hypothetical protein
VLRLDALAGVRNGRVEQLREAVCRGVWERVCVTAGSGFEKQLSAVNINGYCAEIDSGVNAALLALYGFLFFKELSVMTCCFRSFVFTPGLEILCGRSSTPTARGLGTDLP